MDNASLKIGDIKKNVVYKYIIGSGETTYYGRVLEIKGDEIITWRYISKSTLFLTGKPFLNSSSDFASYNYSYHHPTSEELDAYLKVEKLTEEKENIIFPKSKYQRYKIQEPIIELTKFPMYGWCKDANNDLLEYLDKIKNGGLDSKIGKQGLAWNSVGFWAVEKEDDKEVFELSQLKKFLKDFPEFKEGDMVEIIDPIHTCFSRGDIGKITSMLSKTSCTVEVKGMTQHTYIKHIRYKRKPILRDPKVGDRVKVGFNNISSFKEGTEGVIISIKEGTYSIEAEGLIQDLYRNNFDLMESKAKLSKPPASNIMPRACVGDRVKIINSSGIAFNNGDEGLIEKICEDGTYYIKCDNHVYRQYVLRKDFIVMSSADFKSMPFYNPSKKTTSTLYGKKDSAAIEAAYQADKRIEEIKINTRKDLSKVKAIPVPKEINGLKDRIPKVNTSIKVEKLKENKSLIVPLKTIKNRKINNNF